MIVQFEISERPIGKPRMTRQDRWKKRKCVTQYWSWKDEAQEGLKAKCLELGLDYAYATDSNNTLSVSWVAEFKVTNSWSKKKKRALIHMIHRNKPDRDNIDKALLDALFKDDSGVGVGLLKKLWSDRDCLTVSIEYKDP